MLTEMQKEAIKHRIESEYDAVKVLGNGEAQAILGHIAFDFTCPLMAAEDMSHIVAGYVFMDRTNFFYGREDFVKRDTVKTLEDILRSTYESILDDINDMTEKDILNRIIHTAISGVDVLLRRIGDPIIIEVHSDEGVDYFKRLGFTDEHFRRE